MATTKAKKSTAAPAEARNQNEATADALAAAKPDSKAALVITLLKREGGATLEQMVETTGWQKHSVRGFMAGVLKKRHGLAVTSEKTNQVRRYWIAGEPKA